MKLQPEHGVQANITYHTSPRASIIRGTASLALCSVAVGSVICEVLGVHYGALAQLPFGIAGVIAGLVLSARETR